METVAVVLLLTAVLSSGAVYGTDLFCALVQRAAMSRVDDRTLGYTMGFVHYYGDKRMPVVGAVATISTSLACVAAAVAGSYAAAVLVGSGLAAAVVWLVIFARVSSPINKVMTAAAVAEETPGDIRDLQKRWDRVITVRAALQGYVVLALCLAIALL